MIDPVIRDELLEQLGRLTPNMQRRVADFAAALVRSVPEGTPGDVLLRFAGVLDPEDAKAMMEAIEMRCR